MQEAVCKLSILTISKIPPNSRLWLASQFSWPQEACCRLINQIQAELLTQIYSYGIQLLSLLSSQSIVHIKCVFLSSFPKGAFLGAGKSSSEICSLPYSLLLDYSTLRSLPYPTLLEVEKPLLVGAWCCAVAAQLLCRFLKVHQHHWPLLEGQEHTPPSSA